MIRRVLLTRLVVKGSLAVLAALVATTACGRDRPAAGPADRPGTGPAVSAAGPVVYVAVGASETVGVGSDDPANDAWPEVLRRTALPPEATFVNVGISGATVAVALAQELPRALERSPTLVTVWLNVNDLLAMVPVETYEAQLRQLVHALRGEGRTRVLVANTPSLDRLPSYLACLPEAQGGGCRAGGTVPPPELVNLAVAAYNGAIDQVARDEGAEVVDLNAALLASRAEGTDAALVSADGFHPSTSGHRLVAAAFARALARQPG